MLNNIENCFRDFVAAIQVARLYPEWHPQFQKGITRAFDSISAVLKERDELVLGIVGEELAFEKEIFFDLSAAAKEAIVFLKQRQIERVQFSAGLKIEELAKLISFLVAAKDVSGATAQERFSLLGINNISIGKIGGGGSGKDAVKQPGSRMDLYRESLDSLSGSFDSVLEQKELNHLALKLTVKNVMENLLGRYQEFLEFAIMKRYDIRTFSHVLNVSILSMYFSSKLLLRKDEIINIGISALFHDIGKMYISRRIIRKPDKLTEEEFFQIENHSILGTEIMLRHVDSLGPLPAIVCFEHHLGFDLSGYPKLRFPIQPIPASQIVSICDVYDALSQRRSYKWDYPPETIYRIISKEKRHAYDTNLLDKFFQIMGVWPIGTIVLLSDSRVAVVREENEDDVFAPKVEIIAPQAKNEIIDLRAHKEEAKIARSLNPLSEGKEYLHLIHHI